MRKEIKLFTTILSLSTIVCILSYCARQTFSIFGAEDYSIISLSGILSKVEDGILLAVVIYIANRIIGYLEKVSWLKKK